MLVVVTITGALAALLVSLQLPRTYESQARLLVGPALQSVRVSFSEIQTARVLAELYTDLVTTGPVLDSAARRLGLDGAAALGGTVTARTPASSSFVEITAQGPTGEAAAARANAAAAALIEMAPDVDAEADLRGVLEENLQTNQRAIDATEAALVELTQVAQPTDEQRAEIARLENDLVTLRSTRAALLNALPGPAANVVQVIDPATAPAEPVAPRMAVNGLLGAALGFGAGLLVALAGDRVRHQGSRQVTVGGRVERPSRAR